jgi:hypothetical protein
MNLAKRVKVGTEAGMLGGAGVVLLFFVQDALHLQPLATPAALSANFFGPANVPMEFPAFAGAVQMAMTGGSILAYTVLHFLAFSLLGIGASFVLGNRGWLAMILGGSLFGATACSAAFFGSAALMGSVMPLESIAPASIVITNAFAGALMGFALEVDAVVSDEEVAAVA